MKSWTASLKKSKHLNVFQLLKKCCQEFKEHVKLWNLAFLLLFCERREKKCPTCACTALGSIWCVVSQVLGQWEMSWSPITDKKTRPFSVISPFIIWLYVCYRLLFFWRLEWSVLNEQGCCCYLVVRFNSWCQLGFVLPCCIATPINWWASNLSYVTPNANGAVDEQLFEVSPCRSWAARVSRKWD